MLPVSLEVTSQPLLFCPQQYLDFGVVEASDPAKTLKLFIINSGNRPITVQVSICWLMAHRNCALPLSLSLYIILCRDKEEERQF